jgi:HD-GYP domain-containing protein (c-di-GMP phosphodiesterase class II)
MKLVTTNHPLEQLHRALREADVVLVPIDANDADPFPGSMSDILRTLCTSPMARALITRASARWTVSAATAQDPLEPRVGLIVLALPIQRTLAGGRFAAVTLLSDAIDGETVDQLAHSARIDARIARTILATNAPWERRSVKRLARLVASLARSEGERLVGVEAGTRLSAAWEELHLLHSLSSEMTLGSAPESFITRTLTEVRETLGCSWTALRVSGAAEPLLDASLGGIVSAGIAPAAASKIFDNANAPSRAIVVGTDLVLAPVRRNETVLGLLAAGDRRDGDNAMSNWERTLVETAAGHLAVFLDNARLYRDLDAMFMGSLSALVSAIDAKDPYTRGHSQRVALLSRQIAEAAGLASNELKNIHIAGLVHDVGKIGMPEAILRKQDRLTEEEFAVVKQHPEIGFRILRDIPQFAPVLDGVRYHHERIDGRGYPHGLKGSDIPLFARIIAIADTFDAMSSNRTYRAAKPREVVLAEMLGCAGSQLDPKLFAHFRSIELRGYDALNAAHAAAMRDAA